MSDPNQVAGVEEGEPDPVLPPPVLTSDFYLKGILNELKRLNRYIARLEKTLQTVKRAK